jgi:hypothetical protein
MKRNFYKKQIFSGSNFRLRFSRGFTFGIIILTALIAFEIFNFSTTEYALEDLLGNLTFLGLPWATILAIAFCGIDFAGIARLHTPEEGSGQINETWYLFGAWLLAATMNAMLTWWGVSLALVNHTSLGNSVIDRTTLLRIVPIFVAVLIWLIRVLIIGTYSSGGNRLFSQRDFGNATRKPSLRELADTGSSRSLTNAPVNARPAKVTSKTFSAARRSYQVQEPVQNHPEPQYVPVNSATVNPNKQVAQSAGSQNSKPYSSENKSNRSRSF